MDDSADREKDCEETPVCSEITVSAPESPPHIHTKDHESMSDWNNNDRKSRVKRSSRRLFLDSTSSVDETEKALSGGLLDAFSEKNWSGFQLEGTENRGSDCMIADEDSSLSTPPENSWMCPLTLDKCSPSPSYTETEDYCSLPPVRDKSPVRSKKCSGVILKLRRMFGKGLNRKKACYQAVSDSGTSADPSLLQTGDGELSREKDIYRRTSKGTHRWQRTGSFCHTLRPLSTSSHRKHRSLLKIKYCPYLTACHSAEHRRVLRSAVQRARRAMRFYYPDLVGKKIRHLYEEDDKSEVWYRGEVMRVHEAHTDPIKTIFEVTYDSEPGWKYYLELLIDYKKGWLKVED